MNTLGIQSWSKSYKLLKAGYDRRRTLLKSKAEIWLKVGYDKDVTLLVSKAEISPLKLKYAL